MMNKFIVLLLSLFSFSLYASNVPYFVSIKSNKVNMRTGPGFHYHVKWIYICKNFPLKVIEEFESWKKVCDMDEDYGWIKGNLLNSKRYAVIKEDTFGYKKQSIDSKFSMKIDKSVIMRIEKCSKRLCFLSASKCKALVQKKFIWGVD
ncbi:MAG: SH3 domain-containing protein [Wolbachia sp.]|nr:SH3 domain-containing protein [Wolbachia sp.]MDD9336495.1 SH3 domain-containing protein [Wolbachia sp.]